MDRTDSRPPFHTTALLSAVLLSAALFSAALLSAAPARAREPAEPDRSEAGDQTFFGENGKRDEDGDDDHEGFFSRLSVGIGYGLYDGSGRADPVPGVEVIEDPAHDGPALNASLDAGLGIIDNLALHVGLLYETLLTHNPAPNIGSFFLLGAGGGVSYYFMPPDLYLTGQIRWIGAVFFLPDAPCDFLGTGRLWGRNGIGLSLAFGKEWFPDDGEVGFGLGLQINYAHLPGTPAIDYFSLMLAPTLTRF
jgi:hypothetical protein